MFRLTDVCCVRASLWASNGRMPAQEIPPKPNNGGLLWAELGCPGPSTWETFSSCMEEEVADDGDTAESLCIVVEPCAEQPADKRRSTSSSDEMAPAGGGVKGFYRQRKKRGAGGVAKPPAGKRSKSAAKPPPPCTTTQGNAEEEEEEALRRFDMDMAYGPCIGVTRLRRWERAEAMGLRPPPHLRDLILRHHEDPKSCGNGGGTSLECLWAGKV
ncbi:hypothetical protein ACP70R_000393 [Stipagrostis hirtigluma subsp. patula]